MRAQQIFEKLDFEFDSPLDPSYKVRVYKNPSHAEMESVRGKTASKELRGLVFGDNVVYIWDANLATHDNLMDVLAIDRASIMRFIVGPEGELISAEPMVSTERLMSSPMMSRMMIKRSIA
jgi:hypothetical protein